MKYIHIKDWESHQHYKDRRPTWVKLEIEIIDEFDKDGNIKKFFTLPDSAKLTFIGLLCLRANYHKHIPFKSKKWLSERLGIKNIDLESLENTGYITIDSETVSKPYQDDTLLLPPEREREREKEGEIYKISVSLFEQIQKRKPDYKKPNFEMWNVEVERMIRIDKRDIEKIKSIIVWCQQDDFWQNNILSVKKLRKHFDKLELEMNKTKPKQNNNFKGMI